jgi:ABC-type transport system involved in cytochrome c biogenesis permease component
MNIKIKAVLRWLLLTNILIIALPMVYMIQNTTIDIILVLTVLIGTFKLLLTLCFLLFGVTERRKSERQFSNKWIR